MVLFSIKDLCKNYVSGEVVTPVLQHVEFSIERGEFVTILGPSGSGKTTLLNILSGLDCDYEGEVNYKQKNIRLMSPKELELYRRNEVSLIFQQYYLLSTLTVQENVQVGKYLSQQSLEIDQVLEKVGMLEHKHKYPSQLSGGQKQRVAIARAVVKSPNIIFCDEPTGALDSENAKVVMELLVELNKQYGLTIIMVTHHEAFAQLSSKVIKMEDGRIESINSTLTSHENVW